MSKRSIVHIEMSTRNRAATATFLAEMFGWDNIQHFNELAPYTTFSTGNVGGGLTDEQEGRPAGSVLLYVGSDDIEADLQKAQRLGAKVVVPKTEVPGVGWFAIIEDLYGSRIALWS